MQVLDIVIPENRSSEKLPAIVYIHGGGWLGGDKGNADKYGIDKESIGVWGTSAGGHLVAMLALTSVSGNFEGTVGNYPEENGSVACAIDGYGPGNLGIQEVQAHVNLSWNGRFIGDC